MNRIKSLDLARGFTVLMIAPIHTVLVYSKMEVRATTLGYVLGFIAEGPGAQLFMLLMGIYVSFQKQLAFKTVCRRAFILLLAGYILNVLKFCLPLLFGWLPPALLNDLQAENCGDLFLIGDILHFAAIALIILHVIEKLPKYNEKAVIACILVCFLSPYLWDLITGNPVIDYGLKLMGGQAPQVFFPLAPWIVYPLVGLTVGYCLVRKDKEIVFRILFFAGSGCIITGLLIKTFLIKSGSSSFYRTYPGDTMIHLGIVLVWLWVWRQFEMFCKPNLVFKLLEYCSRNITTIYILQWIVIMWLLPFFGYHDLNLFCSLIAISLTAGLTMACVLILNHFKKMYAFKKDL